MTFYTDGFAKEFAKFLHRIRNLHHQFASTEFCLWLLHPQTVNVNVLNICFYFRKLLETIDQSEFEGFEYVNPLLTSAEEAV